MVGLLGILEPYLEKEEGKKEKKRITLSTLFL
jgi:hypothetical protein